MFGRVAASKRAAFFLLALTVVGSPVAARAQLQVDVAALDPALPRELLPPRWTGTRAAELFFDRHERWTDDARREWKRLNSQD